MSRERRPRAVEFRQELAEELKGNILPFWIRWAVDRVHGGFHGGITNDLEVRDEVPRSAVLCARILWTFSAVHRRLGGSQYLAMASRAFDYLQAKFWDHEFGGLFWQVDRNGRPVRDHKHLYAQAFGIYGLSEYYRAVQQRQSLAMAQELFHLVEAHGYDPMYGGYIEARSRGWGELADMRLSDRDLNCWKSMNTMLHLVEAYSNLSRVWPDEQVTARQRGLVVAFLEHILDPHSAHLRLYFDREWHSLLERVSFGHDIEASWLLMEAAGQLGDAALQSRVQEASTRLAESVLREGVDKGGGVLGESDPQGLVERSRSWWAQAEAVVGFYNAYQVTGDPRYWEAAQRCWRYIRERFVDRKYGEWFKRLHEDGTPDNSTLKAGPWECPYHQSRACLEMLDRLEAGPG